MSDTDIPTYTPEVDAALDVLARKVAADVLDAGGVEDRWETYPDLGEYDWTEVAARARALVRQPLHGEFQAAYDLIAARATEEA